MLHDFLDNYWNFIIFDLFKRRIESMIYENDLELFRTQIGSQMWKMDHENSDTDIAIVYMTNSRDFLLGKRVKGKFTKKEAENIDLVYYEIGHVIAQLMKGNVNFLWLVLSPLEISGYHSALDELKTITSLNLSKASYHSIKGLAKHNIYHFIENGDSESLKYKKKLGIIGRTLLFGINMLLWGKAMFKPVYPKDSYEIDYLLDRLNNALETSKLPEKPDPKPFQDYLVKYRLLKLKLDGLHE